MADWTGKARKTVADRLADLAPIDRNNRNAFYDSRQALPILYGVDDERKGRLDLSQERAKLSQTQRERVQLDVQRLRGELLAAADVEAAWSDCIGAFRARMLALPIRIAQTAISATSVKEIEAEARKEIDAALEELGRGTGTQSRKAGRPTSKAKGLPVGRAASPPVS